MYNAYRLQYIQAASKYNLQVKLSSSQIFCATVIHGCIISQLKLNATELCNLMNRWQEGEGARRISYLYPEDGSHMFSKTLVPVCHITQWHSQSAFSLHVFMRAVFYEAVRWHAVVFIYPCGISPQESQIMSPSHCMYSLTLSHLHTGCIWIYNTRLAID
jgi:hypothetical protein